MSTTLTIAPTSPPTTDTPGWWGSLAYLASGLPLGIAWLVLLITGWALSVGLAIIVVGVAVLAATLWATHAAAALERTLVNSLLGGRIAPAGPPPPGGMHTLRRRLSDAATWRFTAHLLLRATLGLATAIISLSLLGYGLLAMGAPAWYRLSDQIMGFGSWHPDSLDRALLLAGGGVLTFAIGLVVVRPLGALWLALGRGLLNPSREPLDGPGAAPAPVSSAADPAAAPTAVTRPARPAAEPGRLRRAVVAHGLASGLLGAVLVIIWAATTPDGYFWPIWPLLVAACAWGIHAAAIHLFTTMPGRTHHDRHRRGLAIHTAVMICIGLYITAIWALTSLDGHPWFVWVLLGLAVPPAIHMIALVAGGDHRNLTQRIEILTQTRQGAVDAQAAELQRIERDLHDGAQARLVAIAMELGRAESRIADDPEAARRLVAEARAGTTRALEELRALARGIYPPVLTDRGLGAAVTALAGRAPVPVQINDTLTGRPAAAVEAAAYFVVSESLANATKHAPEARVTVDLSRAGDSLRVRVSDDGPGGADPEGSGLDGLRRRVEALDGGLRITSPAGGPTLIDAVLPWGRPAGADPS